MTTTDTTALPLLLTAETAARLLSVSVRTVWRMCDDGSLETVKIGSKRLIRTQSVEVFAGSTLTLRTVALAPVAL